MNDMEEEKTTKKGNQQNDDLAFEDALNKLETYVRQLEQGDLTLEDSLNIFEEGMELAKFCSKKLDDAEQKIQLVLEKDGDIIKTDYEANDD